VGVKLRPGDEKMEVGDNKPVINKHSEVNNIPVKVKKI